MPNPDQLNLSIIIITYNEEHNLRRCLQSLPPGSEVFILDSGSTDQTLAIAKEWGATVAQRPFTNYAEQKNAAIAMATRPWVLSIDADECLDRALSDEITRIIADSPAESAFRVRRQLVFMGRIMRFGKTNDSPIRLFRRGQGTFGDAIHESLKVNGSVGQLAGTLFHHSYADLSDYFARFNAYTTMIAENHHQQGRQAPSKMALICRFWLEFGQRYLLRLGFLDGYPGYVYALISSLYAFTKYEKLRERLATSKN